MKTFEPFLENFLKKNDDLELRTTELKFFFGTALHTVHVVYCFTKNELKNHIANLPHPENYLFLFDTYLINVQSDFGILPFNIINLKKIDAKITEFLFFNGFKIVRISGNDSSYHVLALLQEIMVNE